MTTSTDCATNLPIVVLPSGRSLLLERSRWDGPLDPEELAWCRAHRVPLAFDPAQSGWVVHRAEDPIDELRRLAAGTADRAEIHWRLTEFARSHGLRAADAAHWLVGATIAKARERAILTALPGAEHFTFRPWEPDDAAAYRTMLDNPRLWRFLPEPFPGPLTEQTARSLIAIATIDGRQETLAVERDGSPIGQCLLRFDEPAHGVRAAEVAYWLAEAHQGKGWMAPALSAFLLRGFRMHAIDVVYAWIHTEHAASARIATRCGFSADDFPLEHELAAATRRPGFRRFVTHRAQWAIQAARAPLLYGEGAATLVE